MDMVTACFLGNACEKTLTRVVKVMIPHPPPRNLGRYNLPHIWQF